MNNRKLFIASALIPPALDCFVTLTGQSSSYWLNSTLINEGSPVTFLPQGPVIYILSFLVYIAFLGLMLYLLPKQYALLLGILIVVGHSWGAMTWLYIVLPKTGLAIFQTNEQKQDWFVAMGYFALISFFFSRGIIKLLQGPGRSHAKKKK